MNLPSYIYNTDSMTVYTFTSVGRKRIEKMVEFTSLGIKDVYNLAFGDLLPNGTIDDTSNSNNGDILKVMATVIRILKDFAEKNPAVYIFFTGSSEERMRLCRRILKSYYLIFSKDFKVMAYVKIDGVYSEVKYDPQVNAGYEAFIVKKIN